MTHASVNVQIAPESVPTTPSWFGEVAVVAHVLHSIWLLDAIEQRVRFARARFDHYERLILWSCSSAMRSVVNPASKPFMSVFGSFFRAVHGALRAKPSAPSQHPLPFSGRA